MVSGSHATHLAMYVHPAPVIRFDGLLGYAPEVEVALVQATPRANLKALQ